MERKDEEIQNTMQYKIKFVKRTVVDMVESEALGGQRWLNVAGTGG